MKLLTLLVTIGFTACTAPYLPMTYAQQAHTDIVEPGATEVPQLGSHPKWVIAVHGGAGVKARELMTPELQRQYRAGLKAALEAGGRVLAQGGAGPQAIEAALVVLEDSPIFNAGRGAALDANGNARHDASIMLGSTRDAGAIAGSTRIRNPITAARAVMEKTDNVLLHGDGADWFASQQGLALADPLYFQTDERRQSLMDIRALEASNKTAANNNTATNNKTALERAAINEWAAGTVGAVVLDQYGNLSAGTSTGGRTNKRFGRIGDSPIIGAGTYASNQSCAVSATGHGEYFMRWTVARDVCARVEFANETLEQAAHTVVIDTLQPLGGLGAIIAIDPKGKVVFSMNGNGMYRGVMSAKNAARTGIYAEDPVK